MHGYSRPSRASTLIRRCAIRDCIPPAAAIRLAAVFALGLASLGLVAHPVPADDGVTIRMANYAFAPQQITIPAGTAVAWINQDRVNHAATSSDGLWDSGEMGSAATSSMTFTDAGTFPCYCIDHPDMIGTIIVTGAEEWRRITRDDIKRTASVEAVRLFIAREW